jgi:hypothetical protein
MPGRVSRPKSVQAAFLPVAGTIGQRAVYKYAVSLHYCVALKMLVLLKIQS